VRPFAHSRVAIVGTNCSSDLLALDWDGSLGRTGSRRIIISRACAFQKGDKANAAKRLDWFNAWKDADPGLSLLKDALSLKKEMDGMP
jgi:hypothetical protein